MAEYTKFKTNRNKDASLLLNGTYVRNQPYPTYNFSEASNAFKKLGYIRGGVGQKINGNITSGINPNRVINGKKSPHGGYDIGAAEGQTILNCNMAGTVVKAGYLDDFGNFLIIKYNNGTYARMGHLKNNTSALVNKTISPNQKLGYVGHTGHATGSHLHADFFDRNLTRINAETFAKGL
jgi:murein DD-endopeptidase MepM/ murein hydrolase activator NlpD